MATNQLVPKSMRLTLAADQWEALRIWAAKEDVSLTVLANRILGDAKEKA